MTMTDDDNYAYGPTNGALLTELCKSRRQLYQRMDKFELWVINIFQRFKEAVVSGSNDV